jgi:cytochrome c oxidase subunit II
LKARKGEITVKKGEPVTLELVSADLTRGFTLPEFGIRAEVKPGEIRRVHIKPDKAGRFAFACDVFCGSGHEEMAGALVVTE